jgi:hypothetical protein
MCDVDVSTDSDVIHAKDEKDIIDGLTSDEFVKGLKPVCTRWKAMPGYSHTFPKRMLVRDGLIPIKLALLGETIQVTIRRMDIHVSIIFFESYL